MIFAVKKFRHYLLATKFVFFTDHQALLYLVNKPCNTGHIVRWFLILLEFDFTVIAKKGITHQRADHLSILTNGEEPKGINDDLPDAFLFNIEMVPRWSEELIPMMTICQFSNIPCPFNLHKAIIERIVGIMMIASHLYKKQQNGVYNRCIGPKE